MYLITERLSLSVEKVQCLSIHCTSAIMALLLCTWHIILHNILCVYGCIHNIQVLCLLLVLVYMGTYMYMYVCLHVHVTYTCTCYICMYMWILAKGHLVICGGHRRIVVYNITNQVKPILVEAKESKHGVVCVLGLSS